MLHEPETALGAADQTAEQTFLGITLSLVTALIFVMVLWTAKKRFWSTLSKLCQKVSSSIKPKVAPVTEPVSAGGGAAMTDDDAVATSSRSTSKRSTSKRSRGKKGVADEGGDARALEAGAEIHGGRGTNGALEERVQALMAELAQKDADIAQKAADIAEKDEELRTLRSSATGSAAAAGAKRSSEGAGAGGQAFETGPPTGVAPKAPPAGYLSSLFVKKLPEVPNYIVPAWAADESARAAPWYLEVYKGAERIDTIDLSGQSRFVCGRPGGEAHSVDLDLSSHHTISRYARFQDTSKI